MSSLSLVPLGAVNTLKEDLTSNSGQTPRYELDFVFKIHMHYFWGVIPFVLHLHCSELLTGRITELLTVRITLPLMKYSR